VLTLGQQITTNRD